MTADELAKLKELESKATKGPWRYAKESRDGKRQFVQSDGDNWNCCRLEVDSDDCDYEMAVANAELIPALRNAAPALIALAEWAITTRNKAMAGGCDCTNESTCKLCDALDAYPEGE